MDNLKTEKIEIQSTETKVGVIKNGARRGEEWEKTILEDVNGIKFNFWATKQNGNNTKAFEFYSAHKKDWNKVFLSDGTVEVSVVFTEEEKTFIDEKTGKNIDYTDRNIKMFEAIDDGSQPDPDIVLAGDAPPPQEPPTVEECNVEKLKW